MTSSGRARSYHRLKRRLGYIEVGLAVLYLAALQWSGASFHLRDLAVGFAGRGALSVLIFFVIGAGIFNVITFPLDLASGYLLEKHYGLLNRSVGGWLIDLLKEHLLGLVLGLAVMELLYLCLRVAGPWWWLPAGSVFCPVFYPAGAFDADIDPACFFQVHQAARQ